MNRFYFFFLFLIFTTQSQAQYRKLLGDNTEWYSISWFEGTLGIKNYISGDTIINGINFKKIYESSYDYLNSGKIGLLREDTIAKKVYLWKSNQEYVLYDFSLKVNDIFNPLPMYIDSLHLDSITTYLDFRKYQRFNETRNYIFTNPKVFYFSSRNSYKDGPIVWVEGIGSLSNLLETASAWPHGGEGESLICHFNSGVRDFHFIVLGYDTCAIPIWLGVKSGNTRKADFDFYPNPASGMVTLNLFSDNIIIEITSVTGNTIRKIVANSTIYNLDITTLIPGIYFIGVKEDGVFGRKKLAVIK